MNDEMPLSLRDKQARQAIELACPLSQEGGHDWHEMEATAPINLRAITEALQWIERRGNQLQGFRAVRHPNHPSLIRFEDAP